MERTFIRLPSFEKAWKALGLGEDAYAELEEMLLCVQPSHISARLPP